MTTHVFTDAIRHGKPLAVYINGLNISAYVTDVTIDVAGGRGMPGRTEVRLSGCFKNPDDLPLSHVAARLHTACGATRDIVVERGQHDIRVPIPVQSWAEFAKPDHLPTCPSFKVRRFAFWRVDRDANIHHYQEVPE